MILPTLLVPTAFSGPCISKDSSLGPTLSLLFLLLVQSLENKWANLAVNTYMCNMQDIAWIFIITEPFLPCYLLLPAVN